MHKRFNWQSNLNGKKIGRKENIMVIAKKLLDMGLTIEQIIEATAIIKRRNRKIKTLGKLPSVFISLT